MSNTIAHPNQFDPTRTADPDEPYFPLMGHDPDAPATVHHWCDLRRKRLDLAQYTATDAPDHVRKELEQISAAEEIAMDMKRWFDGQTERAPLIPDVNPEVEEIRADALRKSFKQELREAAFRAKNAQDGLKDVLDGLDSVQLSEAIRFINNVADGL